MKQLRFTGYIVFSVLSAFAVFATTTYTVLWRGALRDVQSGDVSGKVPLQEFAGKQNLYAVGPLANLGGEITAIAGKFYISRVKNGDVEVDSDLSASASFLVWSEVAAWKPSVPLGAKIDNHAQLEKQLEALATKAGIDTSRPFPFRLKGVVDSVDYHILTPQTRQHHASHSEGAKRISSKSVDAEIIGFYSKNHEGVFTHKGSFAHLHVVERDSSGHVDELSLSADVRVSFPQ